ncbi:MAG: hypothetical protein QXD32_00500 [Nitrososphaerota archaeon]
MAKVSKRCSRCGRDFNSDNALKNHIRAKHIGYYILRYVMPVVLTVVLVASALALAASTYLTTPRTSITTSQVEKEELLNRYLTGHDSLSMHIHPVLKIFVDGREVEIPANIGVEPDGRMRYIHTHDATGVIHIESPVYAEFTLGDFMKIWGKRLDTDCFDIYCGTVKVTVNGSPISNPASYVLRDRDNIVVEVTTVGHGEG